MKKKEKIILIDPKFREIPKRELWIHYPANKHLRDRLDGAFTQKTENLGSFAQYISDEEQ